jgi:branched-chain amino acid transport system ATP-binding protein
MEGPSLLTVDAIHTFYGLSHVLFGVSLTVRPGEVVSLLGRNGAGKTTTLRSIMGLTPPRQGRIQFKDRDITGAAPHTVAQYGLGYVPEDRRIFADLTVRENLEVGRKHTQPGGWDFERVFALFPRLAERQQQRGGSLSGGEQQMLTVARTLMGNPELILLDEPSEGLAPVMVETLNDQLLTLKREGMTILLSEQNLGFTLALADRVYILEKGEVRYSGLAAELEERHDVWQAYLAV